MLRILNSKFLALLVGASFLFQSCQNEALNQLLVDILVEAASGWLFDGEDLDNIPDDVVIDPDQDNKDFAPEVDLSAKFPPIGDQGSYGTCVAWATGYNFKTALDAIDKGWTSSDLANTSNQTSPADLWAAIPSGSRGSGCNGTNFEPALNALISSGAASLSSVPYSKLSCTSTSPKGNSSNKLANFRKICSETEGKTVNNFKYYLNQGRPIAIGAKLGDNFMSWNSSAVIKSDTYKNPGMQHAYHAMVLTGYDDSKKAFRVRNSWGKSWGDNGCIWVDYDFFLNSFVFAAFVGQNKNSVSVSGSSIASEDRTSDDDLLAYSAVDEDLDISPDDPNYDPYYDPQDPLCRAVSYSIYNSGITKILASQKWTAVYMYYNATNAEDYEILFEDYYTDEFGEKGSTDILENSKAINGGYWSNFDIPAGDEVDDYYYWYYMPPITGKYYLVVMADAYDVIREGNENNNFYFITAENGKPLEFMNGVVQNMPKVSSLKSLQKPEQFANTTTQTPVTNANLNAYTPVEISRMLLADKRSGNLAKKVEKYRLKSATMHKVKKVKK